MKIFAFLSTVVLVCSSALSGQTVQVTAKPLTDADIQLLRQDLQKTKNDVISHTMQFTSAEAAAFWPIYNDYARDQRAIADKRLALIKDYAQQYDNITDAKAEEMTQRLFQIESDTLNLQKQYYPKFQKALGAKRAAKFFQVDNRLSMMVNLQLASEIPLIP